MASVTHSTVTLKGRSGASYVFTVYPWGTEFKPLGAVYTILQAPSDGVIYIGQTGDLSERFANHHKANCFVVHRAAYIGILLEPSALSRLAIERDLIANYNTPCND